MLINDIKNISSKKKDLRNFGLVVGGCFAALGIIELLRGRHYGLYLFILGAVLFVLGLVYARLLFWPQKAWMAFAAVLGFIMSHLILFLVFCIVIVPIGVLRKIFGGDFLERAKPHARTYWKLRPKRIFAKADWEKQF